MILESIKLKNIRSYHDQEIEFPKGITLFEGDIGSGKSSILMAVEFAFFGTGSQKGDILLSKKENDGSVTLNFQVGGVNYEVKRGLKRTKNAINQDPKNCHLKIGNEIQPFSPSELKKEVLKILKFNEPTAPTAHSRIYRYAVFTPQEEMKQIITDSDKRLETIRRAFGVEDYKKAIINAGNVSSKINTKSKILQDRSRKIPELERDLIEVKQNEDEKSNLRIKLEDEKKEKENERYEIVKKREDLTEKNSKKEKIEIKKNSKEDELQNKRSDIKDIESEIKDIESEIKDRKEEIQELKEKRSPTKITMDVLELKIKEMHKLEKEKNGLENKRSDIKDIESEIKDIESEIKDRKEEIQELKEKRSPTKITMDVLELKIKEMHKLEKEKNGLESTKSKYKQDISELKKLGTKCLFCHQKITKEHSANLIDEQKQAINKSDSKLDDINKKINKILKEIGINSTDTEDPVSNLLELKDELREYMDSIGKISDLEELQKKDKSRLSTKNKKKDNFEKEITDIENINKKINKILKEIGINSTDTEDPVSNLLELKDELREYMDSIGKISDLEELQKKDKSRLSTKNKKKDNFEKEITDIENTITKFKKSIDALPDYKIQLDHIRTEETDIHEELEGVISKLSGIVQDIKNDKSKEQEIKNEIKQYKKWYNEYKKLDEYYTWTKQFFIPTVDEIEKQILISIQQDFNENYRKWFKLLIDDSSKDSRVDENFTPILEQDGFEQDFYNLSGGEKTSISFAYRLTLNEMMRKNTESLKSNLLILDEPTDGFSDTQLRKVKNVLKELNSEQIILVSHQKELGTYADNSFRISKSDGYSKVKRNK